MQVVLTETLQFVNPEGRVIAQLDVDGRFTNYDEYGNVVCDLKVKGGGRAIFPSETYLEVPGSGDRKKVLTEE